jgi:tRNA U34 5-carboxymethylaminomethyl modifying GTPase MnmE/TrmE
MAKSKRQQQQRSQSHLRSPSDPLTAALQPPPNETPEEREKRLYFEAEAKKVSDGIDRMLQTERNEKRKAKEEVKVLLLGQSESGKSTTLKRMFPFFSLSRDGTGVVVAGTLFKLADKTACDGST